MERDDMLDLLKGLSEGFLASEMTAPLYARTVEGLISSNLDTVPDLEEIALLLADHGVRGAVKPPGDADLRAVARRLIDLAAAESARS